MTSPGYGHFILRPGTQSEDGSPMALEAARLDHETSDVLQGKSCLVTSGSGATGNLQENLDAESAKI